MQGVQHIALAFAAHIPVSSSWLYSNPGVADLVPFLTG